MCCIKVVFGGFFVYSDTTLEKSYTQLLYLYVQVSYIMTNTLYIGKKISLSSPPRMHISKRKGRRFEDFGMAKNKQRPDIVLKPRGVALQWRKEC
jgi:hypothetical protein